MMHSPTGLEVLPIASRRECQSPVDKTTLDRAYSPEGSSSPSTSERHPLLSGALRRGKWTRPEEVFTAATIQNFLDGELELEYGTTLRGYLAQLLHCDPMRISKKLVPGTHLMGVRVDHKMGRRGYYPLPNSARDAPLRRARAKAHLTELWDAFIWSIEQEALQETWSQRSAVHVRENPLISRKRRRVPEGSAGTVKASCDDWYNRPRAKLHKQRPSIHFDDQLSVNPPSLDRLVLADSQLDNRSQRRWPYNITSESFSACVIEASSLEPVLVPPTHPILPPLHFTLQRAINT